MLKNPANFSGFSIEIPTKSPGKRKTWMTGPFTHLKRGNTSSWIRRFMTTIENPL